MATEPAAPARSRDPAALARIGAATFAQTYAGRLPGPAIMAHCQHHHTRDAWAAILAQPHSVAWLLHHPGRHPGDTPIGYALLTAPDLAAPDLAAPDLAGAALPALELRRIYLLPAWHGAGHGRALLAAAMATATARGAPRLLLGVWAQNTAALGFYARAGFRQIATRRFAVGDLICDDLVLAKELPPAAS